MRWFRKLFWRLSKQAWEDSDDFEAEERAKARNTLKRGRTIKSSLFTNDSEAVPTPDSRLRANSMSFRLYPCVGGHILECTTYVERKDEHQHTLYMIHEDQDFAKQVAQSIMMEQMKQ